MQTINALDRQQPKFAIKYSQKMRKLSLRTKDSHPVQIKNETITQERRYSLPKNQFKNKIYKIQNNLSARESKDKSLEKKVTPMRFSTKIDYKQTKFQKNESEIKSAREATEPIKKRQDSKKFVIKMVKERDEHKQKQIKKNRSQLTDKKTQLQRVPLQFSDQASWSGFPGRLIFKGHTPHNSLFLMNNLQQCSQNSEQNTNKLTFDSDLYFNSKFESGNLQGALRIHKRQYWLFMREDTNSFGLRQWFFFEVICPKPAIITFRIYKFSKKYSLYRYGMKPYIKESGCQWMQKGQHISYCKDQDMKCYYLKFTFQFKKQKQRILIAAMPPYTYSRLQRFVKSVQLCEGVQVKSAGKTLAGVEIPMIQINEEEQGSSAQDKKAIVIFGRTHPAQTCSNFTIQSMIDKILLNQQLLKKYTFYIIPMLNPDGVISGNHRTSLTGIDLNRKFTMSNRQQFQLFPQVLNIKEQIRKINEKQKIQFIFDMHGHSAKRNIFAYGQKESTKSQKYLKGRIIPKLLGQYYEHFKYQSCLFQSYKAKQKTARVYFGKKYKTNAITFQQSYGFVQKSRIGIKEWSEFGYILIDVLALYTQDFMQKQELMIQKLEDDIQQDLLRQEIIQSQMQKEGNQQEAEKCIDKKQEEERQEEVVVLKEIQAQKQSQQQKSQEEESQMDSGDQDLQNTQQGLITLIKRMQTNQPKKPRHRKSMDIADTNLQLQSLAQPYQTIMHQQKIPIISRIIKMREKRKEQSQLIDLLTNKGQTKSKRQVRQKINELSIKFPTLEKYLY